MQAPEFHIITDAVEVNGEIIPIEWLACSLDVPNVNYFRVLPPADDRIPALLFQANLN